MAKAKETEGGMLASPRALRILHVAPYYCPSVGGLQAHVKAISEGLAARGHDVTVFTERLAGTGQHRAEVYAPSRERINGVDVHRFTAIPAIARPLLAIPGTYRAALAAVGSERYRMLADGPWLPHAVVAAARLKPDVIMVVSAESEALLYQFSLLRHLSSTRLVALPLLHLEYPWSHSPLIARYLSRFHSVIANTEYEREFVDRACRNRVRTCAIGPGVDPAVFRHRDGRAIRERYGLASDKVVGYIGRLEPEKGVVKLVEAMRIVWRSAPTTRLLLAGHRHSTGSAPDRALVATLDALTPAERSRLTVIEGFAESDKAAIFDACDVFAMPSKAESFGIVYLEAWMCEKPVIGARIGAVQCVIDDGRDGLLVTPHDAAEIADAILRLVRDELLSRQLGRRGWEKVMTRFTWDRVTDAVEAAYADTLEQPAVHVGWRSGGPLLAVMMDPLNSIGISNGDLIASGQLLIDQSAEAAMRWTGYVL